MNSGHSITISSTIPTEPEPLKRTPGLGIAIMLLALVMIALFALTTLQHSPSLYERATHYFTTEQIEQGLRFSFQRQLIMWGQTALHWILLLVLVCGGGGRKLTDFWQRYTGGRWLLTLLLVGATVYVLEELLATPLRLVALENSRAWNMTTRSIGDWAMDYALSFSINAALNGIILVIFFGIMWLWPRWWWLIAAMAGGLLGMAYALLVPVFISPLFNTFTPLEDPYLLGRFEAVAAKAGVSVREVLVMDASRRSRHTNAYFTGFGGTRRIVVYDNLLKPYFQADGPKQRTAMADEIESILAHEIGHWYHDHILKGIGLAVLGSILGFFLLDRILRWAVNRRPFLLHQPTDPAAIPLIALLIAVSSWAVAPLELVVSRQFEREADLMSLELARQPQAFIESEKRLVRDNLGNVAPSPVAVWFFSSHPPAIERIEMAETWAKAHGKLTHP